MLGAVASVVRVFAPGLAVNGVPMGYARGPLTAQIITDKYINFGLMYGNDHIFPVLPIKHLVNQDGEPTTPHKLATGKKYSASNLRVLLYPYVV